jgi:chromosomal replication initiation ATPase DnaA
MIPNKEDDMRSIRAIQETVCKEFGLEAFDMRSPSRSRRVARPRQVALYLARTLTNRSLPEIARYFGDRDHTTILHGVRRIPELMRQHPGFAEQVERARINASAAVSLTTEFAIQRRAADLIATGLFLSSINYAEDAPQG